MHLSVTQLNIPRAILIWSCVQSLILCLLSLPCWTMCPQVLYCFLSWTNGPVVACFYYLHLYMRFQIPNCSSIEPNGSLFLLPTLYMHLGVPQLNFPCAMLIWSCVQSFYTDSSQSFFAWTFLVNAWLEMRPKFNAVSSQLDINCLCVLNLPHCPSVGLMGPW